MTGESDAVMGRADLHIHTLASDGTAGVAAILDHVEHATDLDVIALTDHERIDAALVAQAMARDLGLRVEVVIGEEVTTRGGHLLALFIDRPIRPYRSLRESIAAVHEAGGLAIPAHPLVPYPLCAQGRVLRGLLADPDPAVHPDGLETFNPTTLGRPWHRRVTVFANEYGLAHLGNSDAHTLDAIATGWTVFPGRDAAALRTAIETRQTRPRRIVPRDRRSARDVRAAAPQARPGRARRGRRPVAPGRHGPRPRLPRRPAATAALHASRGRRGRPAVKP